MSWRPVALVLFLVAIIAAPAVLASYQITLLNYVGLGSLVALGLVLLTGIAGLTSFGQAAFVGIGAYASAYLTTAYGLSPWLTLIAGLVLSAAAAAVIGWVTLKLSGHYLALSTIAWSLSLYFLVGVLPMFGGHDGITGVPPVMVGPFALHQAWQSYYLIWAFVLLGLLAAHNLLDSRMGRAIRCLRGRRTMAEAFGIDTVALKRAVFILAAMFASVAGWLYAHLLLFVNPSPFGITEGIEYLFMAVVGGAGSIWGAVVGAGLLTFMRDRVQNLVPDLAGGSGAMETVLFGLLMVLVLQRVRIGIVPFVTKFLPPAPPLRVDTDAPKLSARTLPDTAGPLLAVDNITRRFGGLVAVNGVGFSLNRGEILGVIGPNGAGKSTLFNLVTGVLRADGGTISFAGTRIERLPSRNIARLGVARTFQHVQLRSDMSALENVAVGAHLRSRKGMLASILRLDRRDEAALLAEAARQIERVGLAAQMHVPAGSLALGQQRVLEIARALAADPALLLLDEPAAGLRHAEKAALAGVLAQLRREGFSILIVEHDMDFVMKLVDRLVVMDFGQKIAEGLPQEVQNDPLVQEAYLGVAA